MVIQVDGALVHVNLTAKRELLPVPATVMFVVLIGAWLHATWNALTKSGHDPLIDTTLILLGGSLLSVIVLPFVGTPAPASWPFIAVSSILELVYFVLLAAAYRLGDMSLAYPLMRGTAPLLVALASGLLLNERLGLAVSSGVGTICAGVLTMALAHRRRGGDWRPVTLALANAVVIAAYTMVDGIGARRSARPSAYIVVIFLSASLMFVPWIAAPHRRQVADALRQRWPSGLAGGACVILSYGFALWAMTRAPIAPVAALRETSILFGLVLARLALHERMGLARLAGGLLILSGAAILRLG
jgi:drug/metabolite transporter (DMT)-like permease